jgi:hypothetical protein
MTLSELVDAAVAKLGLPETGPLCEAVPTTTAPATTAPTKAAAAAHYRKMKLDCGRAYNLLRLDLLSSSAAAMIGWRYASQTPDGTPDLSVPRHKNREVAAEYIVARRIEELGFDNQKQLLLSSQSPQRHLLAPTLLSFDPELFCSRSQPYQLMSPGHSAKWLASEPLYEDDLYYLIGRVIPSQVVAALTSFALAWSIDVPFGDPDWYLDYLVETYGWTLTNEHREDWQRCRASNERLRAMAVLERTSWVYPKLLSTASWFSDIGTSDPFLFRALANAFAEKKDGLLGGWL